MKLLLDQNLSHKMGPLLGDAFPGSGHVREHALARAEDADVWVFAREQGFTIVSKDDDFNHRALVLGHPPKVVWLRLGNCTTRQATRALLDAVEELRAFDADPDQSLMIIAPTGTLRR